MKIELMRKIDFWAGVPLAAVSTLMWRLVRWLWPPRPMAAEQVRRLLFIELSEMGSTILADPAMRRAQALYPRAYLYFLIFAKNRGSLDILNTIERRRVFTIRSDTFWHLTWDTWRVIWRMYHLRFDMTVDLELFSRFSSLLTLLSGAPWRVGFHNFYGEGLYRGGHLTHPVLYNPHQHIAKNFLALVHAPLQAEGELPHTKRVFHDDEIRLTPCRAGESQQQGLRERLYAHAPVLKRVRRWVILNPNASEMLPLRKWPLEHFAQLAHCLLQDPDVALLLTGTAAERSDARQIQDFCQDERVVDLMGFTRLEDLPILYSLCAAMVTNDSGPAHFAAPTGLRTFVLFGPETPRLYGALNPNASFIYKGLACSPCVSAANHRKSPCNDNQCMKQITVEEVYEAVRDALSQCPTSVRIDPKRQIS